jgi:hypothetical protein
MGIRPSVQATVGVDQRKAVCSICGRGIFTGQASVWSRKPLGLVHTECVPTPAPTARS